MAIGQDRVIDARTSCRGNVSLAANKLGVNRRTISRWLAKEAHLREIVVRRQDRSVEALEAEHRALDEEMERYWADRQAHEMLK